MIRWQLLLAGAVAVWLFFRNLPGALLCLWPGLLRARETDDDGSLDPAREPAMERIDGGLRALGFEKVGALSIRPPLSAGWAILVYATPGAPGPSASKGEGAFADVGVREGALSVTFFTPFAGGGAILTSDHRRPAIERPGYLAGGLAGTDVPELWAVHRRRIEHFERPGVPWTDWSIAGRVAADEALYRGPGRRELRVRSAPALLVTALALALILISALQLARQLR